VEEPGLEVVPEVKAFRSRDDLLFGLPYPAAVIVIAVTALILFHAEKWTAAAAFFFLCAGVGKMLAMKDPYWLELLPKFIELPRFLGHD
jgi:type IV secretory pathway VirB3-like protein